jgi:putative transposase
VIDGATRAMIGWSAGLAESALTVAAALRHAVTVNEQKLYGGMIDILYTDGGSGNLARINADDVTGLFARLGTTFEHGRPGNPQGRGLIEKSNQSIWIRGAKWLPACTAASMDKGIRRQNYLKIQKDIKEQGKSQLVMSWPQFLEHCQQIVDDYNRRPHSALPKIKDPETGLRRHMSPLEMWAWHIADGWDHKAHQLTEAEIEVLWLPREARTVQRATVQLGNNHYYNADLAHYDRREVQVAYFPSDASKVQVWDKEGRLICYAHYEKNLVDFFPKAMVEQAMEKRTKRRAEIKRMQLEEIYDEGRGVIEIRPQPKPKGELLAFPGMALGPDRIAEAREQMAARIAREKEESEQFRIPTNDRDMMRLWRELDQQLRDGGVLEERAIRFYESFRNSTTYRTFVEVERDLAVKRG